MSTPTYAMRPPKRRRIKTNDPLREDDVEAQGALTIERVIMQTKKGPVERKILARLPKAKISTGIQENTQTEIPIPPDASDMFHTQDYGDMEGTAADTAAAPAGIRKVNLYISLKKLFYKYCCDRNRYTYNSLLVASIV